MTTQCVSIFGAGNGGLAAAFDFSRLGADVLLYDSPAFDHQINAIAEKGSIEAVSHFDGVDLPVHGQAQVAVTKAIETAVAHADILVLPVPSFAQEPLFESMLPYLRNGQVIVLMPGNYGSLVLNDLKRQRGYGHLDLTFVDAISLPWATRIVGDAQIAIFGTKNSLPIATLPANRITNITDRLQGFFPVCLTALSNVIAAGMENINFGGHPLLTMLNIGLLENADQQINYYRDCCSPAVARAGEQLDSERLSVGRALALKLRSELESMNLLYGMNAESVYEFNRTSEVHGSIQSAPQDSKARYITEDVPYLLVPCYELARLCGVHTPILKSIITLAGAINEENYFETGRTLHRMGLDNTGRDELIEKIL